MAGVIIEKSPSFYTRERPGTNRTGAWVGPSAGLEGCGKSRPIPGFDPRDRPTRSGWHHRLRRSSSQVCPSLKQL